MKPIYFVIGFLVFALFTLTVRFGKDVPLEDERAQETQSFWRREAGLAFFLVSHTSFPLLCAVWGALQLVYGEITVTVRASMARV